MTEIWKDIQGYEGYYHVSNLGEVRSLDRIDSAGARRKGKRVNLFCDKDGYLLANLSKNGIAKQHRVHRLVANEFIKNPLGFSEINHKDENKKNNCADNLEWCNTQYNINYGERNVKVSKALSGENAPMCKLTETDVLEIRARYKRRDKDNNSSILSKEYGVSQGQILRIVKNERWKQI